MKLHTSGSPLRDERGFGLLFGMVATAIVALLAWTMTTTGIIDLTISDHYRNYSAAFYAADGGVEQTLIDFKVDDGWIQDLIDMKNWVPGAPSGPTLTVNGATVAVKLDSDGFIIPAWYPLGETTSLGEAAYSREVYLPPVIAPGECEPTEKTESGSSGSGASKSSSSKSSSSGSGSSKSGDSKSESSKSGSSKSGSSSSGSWAAAFAGAVGFATDGRFLVAGAAAAGGTKVAVCHIPPGNPDNAHTISISESALSAHMNHGDSEGACAGDDSGSGGSKSESSKSGGSGSADSKSMLDDPCSYLDDLPDSASSGDTSSGSQSGDSTSEDSKSKDSKSKDDGDAVSFAALLNAFVGTPRTGLLFAPSTLHSPQKFPQVTICHEPPGNPDNAHTIVIREAAVSAHVGHGDEPGACKGDSSSDSNSKSDSSSESDSSSTSGSSGGDAESEGGEDEDDAEPTSAYVILRVRSTGTRLLSSTIVEADLVFLIGADGALLNIAVQDWRERRVN